MGELVFLIFTVILKIIIGFFQFMLVFALLLFAYLGLKFYLDERKKKKNKK